MQPKSDVQLLREYAERGSDAAFSELVSRHTDLVYSAALRQVDSSDLARDVAQNVFTDLARKARSVAGNLSEQSSLVGWLYRGTRFEALDLRRQESRRQSRERHAMEQLLSAPENELDWERLRPVIDEAMADLSDDDREALLLRFFKNYDLRAVGHAIGVSDDAAQKRVSRALEKLREHLSRRGVGITAVALATMLTANAVSAAPIGLAAALSTGALTGSVLTTAVTTTKVIAMTTLQKTVIAVVLVAGVAAPLLVQHQAKAVLLEENARLRAEYQSLQQQTNEIAQLIAENARLSDLLAHSSPSPSSANRSSELLRLRAQVGRLRMDLSTNAKPADAISALLKSPEVMESIQGQNRALYSSMVDKYYADFFESLRLTPGQAAAMKELLIKRSLKQAEKGIAMVSGDLDNADRVAQFTQFKEQENALVEDMKRLLGDNYSKFAEYDGTVPDRARLANFKDQLATSSMPLDSDQARQLADTLFDLQRNFKYSGDFGDESKVLADPISYTTGQKWEQLVQEAEQFKQAYLTRAKSFLSADQLAAFDKFATREIQAQLAEKQMSLKLTVSLNKETRKQ